MSRIPKLSDQPVVYSAAVKAVLLCAVGLKAVTLDQEQVALIVFAFDALLACLVWPNVTPTTRSRKRVAEARKAGKDEAVAYIGSIQKPAPAKRTRKAAK